MFFHKTMPSLTDTQTAQEKLALLKERKDIEVATLAGGCFWCLESPFEATSGVIEVITGYAGGKLPNPTYAQVCADKTGYRESAQVFFDPKKISYKEILDIFWAQIDPTDPYGQFADKGEHYQTAIFYHTEQQQQIAEESKQHLEVSGIYEKPIYTPILPFTTFYPAEEEHQDYYKKHFLRYKQYNYLSGRGPYTEEIKEKKEKYGK